MLIIGMNARPMWDRPIQCSRALWLAVLTIGLLARPAINAQTAPTAKTPQASSPVGAQPDKRIKRNYGFYEPEPLDFDDHAGYVEIFDGKTLKDWDGDPDTWRVENGALVGESTVEKPKYNSYISFHG